MPKLLRALPLYSLHKRSGQARVCLGGKQVYLGVYDSPESRQRYDRVIAEWLSSGRISANSEASEPLVVDLVIAFTKHIRKLYPAVNKHGKPAGTALNYQGLLREFQESFGDLPTRCFTAGQLEQFRSSLVKKGVNRFGVNERIARIKKMFRWGVVKELVPVAVSHAVVMLDALVANESDAAEAGHIEPVDDAVVDATLPFLTPVVADMVRMQRLTGARPGEIVKLTPGEVIQSGDVWRYEPTQHKTRRFGKKRVVYFGPRGQAILAPYLVDRLASVPCFSPRESETRRRAQLTAKRKTPLSCGSRVGSNRVVAPKKRPGDAYTVATYRRAIERACKKAGVERWNPNQLRHTAATAIRGEFGIEAAQVILGHSRLNTTEIYAEKNAALGVKIAAAIG